MQFIRLAHSKNRAKIEVAIIPIATGTKLRLANSKGETLHTAATGIIAHGIIVPPPTHIAHIWPKAVRVAVLAPVAVANKRAIDPAKDIPEKPEPSSPVITPTVDKVATLTTLFNGTEWASTYPRSLTMPVEFWGKYSPIIFTNPISPK